MYLGTSEVHSRVPLVVSWIWWSEDNLWWLAGFSPATRVPTIQLRPSDVAGQVFTPRALSLALHTHPLARWPGEFDSHLTLMSVSYLPDKLA